nr:MAG TPA: hypothetical protein [Bacteriophage sp.]
MATTTPNHGFIKPAATDNVNIGALNSNMDTLDDLFDAKEITMLNYALAAASAAINKNDTVNSAIGKLEKRLATVEADTGNPEALSASNIAADYTANLAAPADITESDTILKVLQKLMAYIRFWTVRRIAVIDGRNGKSLTAYNFNDVATATVSIPTKLSDLTVTEPLAIANGGTGAATAKVAASELGTCYATCDAAARNVAKTAALSSKDAPYSRFAGSVAYVLFVNGNTAANPTLDVAGTGAAAIINCHTNAAVSATDIGVNMTAHLVFNGSSWVLMNPAS